MQGGAFFFWKIVRFRRQLLTINLGKRKLWVSFNNTISSYHKIIDKILCWSKLKRNSKIWSPFNRSFWLLPKVVLLSSNISRTFVRLCACLILFSVKNKSWQEQSIKAFQISFWMRKRCHNIYLEIEVFKLSFKAIFL